MYLLVFTTLVISLIGLYAQTLTVQAARFAAGQTTVAQAMLAWHATALAEAKYGTYVSFPLGPYTPVPSGCSLVNSFFTVDGGSNCPGNSAVTISIASVLPTNPTGGGAVNLPDCASTLPNTNAPPCFTALPPGYKGGNGGSTQPYTFYSMYYQPVGSTQNYVITFVPPPNPAQVGGTPALINLPGTVNSSFVPQAKMGITMSDLYNQLRNSDTPTMSYGIVKNHLVTTPGLFNGTTTASASYPIPTDGCASPGGCTVPDGSIAIISSP